MKKITKIILLVAVIFIVLIIVGIYSLFKLITSGGGMYELQTEGPPVNISDNRYYGEPFDIDFLDLPHLYRSGLEFKCFNTRNSPPVIELYIKSFKRLEVMSRININSNISIISYSLSTEEGYYEWRVYNNKNIELDYKLSNPVYYPSSLNSENERGKVIWSCIRKDLDDSLFQLPQELS